MGPLDGLFLLCSNKLFEYGLWLVYINLEDLKLIVSREHHEQVALLIILALDGPMATLLSKAGRANQVHLADLGDRVHFRLLLYLELENAKELVGASRDKETKLRHDAKVIDLAHELFAKCADASLALQIPHFQQTVLAGGNERLLGGASDGVLGH